MDEIQALDLMRLQTMGTLHLGKHRHDFLCQSSAGREEEDEEASPFHQSTEVKTVRTPNQDWAPVAYIFCPMVEFSWKSRSTSTSTLQVVTHQVIPPTT